MHRRPGTLTADLSLLLVTAVWGSTFVIIKGALDTLSPSLFIALRFSIAAAFLAMFGGVRAWLQPAALKAGAISGLFLAGGYVFQTVGLVSTTPAKAGFITGLSVVLVPIFLAVAKHQWPSLPVITGVGAAVVGLALLTLGPDLVLSSGDFFVLLCAICFAMQIIMIGRYAHQVEAKALTGVQLVVVASISAVLSLFDPHPTSFAVSTIGAILFTAIPATALAFFVQSHLQRFTTASHTALIFAAEPAFAALFSYLWLGEALSVRGAVGAGCIMAGILVAEFRQVAAKPKTEQT